MSTKTPVVDAFMSHLNLPDGRKVGIPNEFVDLARALEAHCDAMVGALKALEAHHKYSLYNSEPLQIVGAYEAWKREQLGK